MDLHLVIVETLHRGSSAFGLAKPSRLDVPGSDVDIDSNRVVHQREAHEKQMSFGRSVSGRNG
eukprot:2132675-Amphidinium_carterae.1